MENQVRGLVAEQALVFAETVKVEDRLEEDLGLDSFDILELVVLLEEDFSVEIPDEDAEKFDTVNSIIIYLKGKGIE